MIYSTALNLSPEWISKRCLQKNKNHSKISSGAGRFSQNLHTCKKTLYNERNCKSGRHSQQHTSMNRKSQHKTITTDMPYMGLKVKARNESKAKLPSLHRQNQMICTINLRQDDTCQE